MSDDSNGIFSLPAGSIVAVGDTVLPSQHNPPLTQIATALSNRFSKDGRAPATGNWNLNTFRLTAVGDPVANQDATNKAYVDAVGGTAIANKSGNYTVVAGDNGTNIRFTVAATATLTAAATLGNTFRCRIIASNGQVLIDPNGTEAINGVQSLTLNTGQTAYLFCDGSNFVAYVTGDTALGPQLQGYLFGLTATTNTGTPSTNIDVAAGAIASSAAPFYLLQLASSITKNTNTAWSVGTGNGSLDTGAIANSTYYGYVIQRSDTVVVDILTSLSSTSPAMPANYDRRSNALFTFTRTAGVNGAVSPYLPSMVVTQWVAYTPTITGFGTPTNVLFRSRRVGASLEIEGYFTPGTSTAVLASITLGFNGTNGGITVASIISARRSFGNVVQSAVGAVGNYSLALGGDGFINIGVQSVSAGGLTPANASNVATSGNSVSISASLPIQGWNI